MIAGLFGRLIGARGSEIRHNLVCWSSPRSCRGIVFITVGFGHVDQAARSGRDLRWPVRRSDVSWALRIDTLTGDADRRQLVSSLVHSIRSATCMTIRIGRASSPTCRSSPSPC
jgi:hypothetical protein